MSPDEAWRWLREQHDFAGLDVDPEMIASGYGSSGAGLYTPQRGETLTFDESRGGVIVEGSVICDGLVLNRGLVFIRGHLTCRALLNQGYLIVAGDLRCERFIGENETGGTHVLGSAEGAAVTLHVHHLTTGQDRLLDRVDDEAAGREGARARLESWGLLQPQEPWLPWDALTERFSQWAGARPVSPEWTTRDFVPRPPPKPPQRRESSALVQELDAWLADASRSQREKLTALETEWLPRLGPSERAEASTVITRHINSPKLRAARDALLSKLA
ncbi:hypothetical protein MFU01_54210 [Myxococcus fulvus]|uniref:Uncharacterized protein n=1 Tax=Myxococcus fulvus TaxID=33 RepID=A0A511T889_MYXFU|nr:hypothetical protein MFU01_54210 [Myxococcus fulvus]